MAPTFLVPVSIQGRRGQDYCYSFELAEKTALGEGKVMIRANLGLLLSCFRDPWGVAFLFLGVVSDSASIKPTLAA